MKGEIIYGEVGVFMANLEAKTKTKSNSKYTEDWIPS